MSQYAVRIEIDVEADSAEDAVRKAAAAIGKLQDPVGEIISGPDQADYGHLVDTGEGRW